MSFQQFQFSSVGINEKFDLHHLSFFKDEKVEIIKPGNTWQKHEIQ